MAWSKFVLLVAFLSLVVVDGGLVRGPASETRIVGGQFIDIEDAPWQVSIIVNNSHICGGSIISRRWILTAAHCTDLKENSTIEILAGTKSLMEGGTQYPVEEFVNHESYNNPPYSNDISVIKTTVDMNLDGVTMKPVKLPAMGSKRPTVGTELWVSGWGVTEEGVRSTLLKAVNVKVQDFRECLHIPVAREEFEATQICAFNDEGRDSCGGDSGGPLVQDELLVGIVSYGEKYNCGELPSIYTDVAAYRAWIKDHTDI